MNTHAFARCLPVVLFAAGAFAQAGNKEAKTDSADSTIEQLAGLRTKKVLDPFTGSPINDSAAKKLFLQLAPESYGKAVRRLVRGHRNTSESMDFELLMGWVRQSPSEAFEYLIQESPSWLDCVVGNELFESWSCRDQDAALQALSRLRSNGYYPVLLGCIIRNVAVDDPANALSMVPAGASYSVGIIRDVLAYWASKSPEEAAKWVMSRPKRADLVWNLGFAWSGIKHAEAVKWADSLPEDDRMEAHAGIIAEVLMQMKDHPGDVESAAKAFLNQFPNTPLNQDTHPNQSVKILAESIVTAWAKDGKFPTGIEWVMKLKPSDGRDELYARLISLWSEKSPLDALAYAEQAAPSPGKDRAVSWASASFSRNDPERTFDLAMAIKDKVLRQTAFKKLFRNWLLIDPVAAMKHLEQIDPESKIQILKAISDQEKIQPRRTF